MVSGGVRRVYDVYMTCVGRVLKREHAAGARSQVNTACLLYTSDAADE